MASRVPSRPQASLIANATVGSPVSEAVIGRWNNELAYLHCKQVQPIISEYIPGEGPANGSMRVAYNRSPGVKVVRIDVELRRGSGIESSMTLAITSSAGTITLIGDGFLNGTRPIPAGNPQVRSPETYMGFFLVTGITPGTPVELIFTWTNISKSLGLSFVQVVECPLADTNPVADSTTGASGEMGLDSSWTSPGNPIIDGTTTTKNGLVRVIAQLERARVDVRRHIQMAVPEDNTTAWAVTSAVSVSVPFAMHDSDFLVRGRGRKLYLSGINIYQARIRYKHSGANTGNVSFVVTPVGGAPTTTTIALSNSGTWATATGTVFLPTTGTGQEFDIQFKSDTTSGTQYLALLALSEKEA